MIGLLSHRRDEEWAGPRRWRSLFASGPLLFASLLFPSSVEAQDVDDTCDQPIQGIAGNSGYQLRVRSAQVTFLCDGFVETDVFDPGPEVALVHLVDLLGPVTPSAVTIPLRFRAPSDSAPVRLRAVSVPELLERPFQMDAAVPPGVSSLDWSGGVRLDHDVPFEALGLTSWVAMPGIEFRTRTVYLPLRSQASSEPVTGVRMGFVSNVTVTAPSIRMGLVGTDEAREVFATNMDDDRHVGRDELIVFEISDLAPGVYRADFAATLSRDPASGLAEIVYVLVN